MYIIFFAIYSVLTYSQVLVCPQVKISFYSDAPLEDIYAISNNGAGAVNLATDSFVFRVGIRSFEFENDLMQEHFNEQFMESDKYPTASYRGKITVRPATFDNNTNTMITTHGIMNIHGVPREREIQVNVTGQDSLFFFNSKFRVAVADHNIKIPSLLGMKIADTVDVTVEGTCRPYKK